MIKFSVLLPVYIKDNASHVSLAIRSILDQTLATEELIIVCDGPIQEDLENVLTYYSHQYEFIKIVRLYSNQGLGNALNIGLSHCSYELVARMDADDICDPNRFKLQIDRFCNNSSLTITGSYIGEFLYSPNDLISIRKVPLKKEAIISAIKFRNPFNHMSVMYKKSFVIDAGGYRNIPGFEDWDLWFRLLKNPLTDFENLGKVLVFARLGNGMINRRNGYSYAKAEFLFFKDLYRRKFVPMYYTIPWMMRIMSRFLPSGWLKVIYKHVLR